MHKGEVVIVAEPADEGLYNGPERPTRCIACEQLVAECWCADPEQQRAEKALLLLGLDYINDPRRR